MAIEIIKNTMVDPIEMTCECCKSVFTYNFQDIQRREERILFGMNSTIRRVVTCPVCKYDNDVNKVIVELQEDIVAVTTDGIKVAESEEKSEQEGEEKEEIYCTECPYFKDVADDANNWFGALCKKDGHKSAPSMYAIQSLHNDCPLKKEEQQ